MVKYTVDLALPSELPGENAAERRQAMLERIEEDRKKFCREAGLERHRRPADPDRYETEDWRTRKEIDEDWCDIRRICDGSNPEDVEMYLEHRRNIDAQFREAANAWKRGEEASFPVGTYPPGRAQPEQQPSARAPPAAA